MKTRESFTLLDANVVVALLDRKDALHGEAVKMIEESEAERFGILDIILAETYSVIVRRCRERKYDCRKAVASLRELERDLLVVPVSLRDYHEKVVECLKKKPELNYNDWILLLYARDNGLEVLTLDQKLKREVSYED